DLFNHKSVGYAVRQVVERAELMSHGVAYAEERVGKRHTGHGSRVRHLLSRYGVGLTVVIRVGEILEDALESLDSKTVGVVGSHDGSVCLESVGNGVDT